MPPVWQPRATQACITLQIASSPASISASLRQWRSLRRISSAMLQPSRSASASNSVPERNGKGSTVVSGAMSFCLLPSAATSSLTTKPPPTE